MSTGDKNNPFPISFDTAGMARGNQIIQFPLVSKYMRKYAVVGQRDWRNYDIPYLAGYSKDWINEVPIIFVDRDLSEWKHLGKSTDTKRFLYQHELAEKSCICALDEADGRELQRLLILLKMARRDDEVYYHCHGVGTWMEEYAVRLQYKDSGLLAYNKFMNTQVKRAEDERIRRVPAVLDMLPYQGNDREDVKLRRVMQGCMAA
jgi:hypothetical protein